MSELPFDLILLITWSRGERKDLREGYEIYVL